MRVHLVDGTYELFRHYHALPKMRDSEGREVAAVRGVIASMLRMVGEGATHLAVATDQVIESFRNKLWAGYKTGAGVEPDLIEQFPLLEQALGALGLVVWPMRNEEADDALASGAFAAAKDARVEQVILCTPDKDLAQCVRGERVVQLDRRNRITRDEAGVLAKFGILPRSIPDYLALVGDAADGYPGLAGWGAKSAAAVLARYGHLEAIPQDWRSWSTLVTSPRSLSETLVRDWEQAMLFRSLATLRTDLTLFTSVDELHWQGAPPAFAALAARLDAATLREAPDRTRKEKLPARRGSRQAQVGDAKA